MVKSQSPDSPYILHYTIIQGEMGLFLTSSVLEQQRGYLYQNGVEFRQKVIGADLNLFWGHLQNSKLMGPEEIHIFFWEGTPRPPKRKCDRPKTWKFF